jgi:hypothetical protein
MKRFVLMSGVEESDYDELLDRVDLLDDLELIRLNQYRNALAIRQLPGLTEEIWEHYVLHELDGLKEVILFKTALIKLKAVIKELISNARKIKRH